jgi:hypothetical protein
MCQKESLRGSVCQKMLKRSRLRHMVFYLKYELKLGSKPTSMSEAYEL